MVLNVRPQLRQVEFVDVVGMDHTVRIADVHKRVRRCRGRAVAGRMVVAGKRRSAGVNGDRRAVNSTGDNALDCLEGDRFAAVAAT